MDDDSPTLGVGFAISTGGSFDELLRLQQMMGSTEGRVVAEAAKIERATAGMVAVGSGAAQISSFGNVATRELQSVARATNAAERSAEGMVRQLNRQIETFGKSATEIRQMRAEMRAVEAENRGLTEVAARLRAASAEMDRLEMSAVGMGAGVGKSRGSLTQLSFQLNDVATMAMAGAPPMQIFATQIGQIVHVAQMAEGGMRGLAGEIAGAARAALLFTVSNPLLLALTVGALGAAAAMKSLHEAANEGTDMRAYAASLGLSEKELRKLNDLTVTFGDTAKAVFQVTGRAIWNGVGDVVNAVWSLMGDWITWIGQGVKAGVNFLVGGFIGAFNAISATWRQFPAALGDAFYSGVNAAIGAINALVQKAVGALNAFIAVANAALGKFGFEIPQLSAPQIGQIENEYAGAFAKAGNAARAEFDKAMGVDYLGDLGSAIIDQARQNARDRIRAQAEAKGFLEPDKAGRGKAPQLSDAEKAYRKAAEAARDYAAAQLDEAAKVGMSAKALRLYADAAAIAKAPTDALKQAIREAAAVREAAYSRQAASDFDKNVLQPLRDELALHGLVGEALAAAKLQREMKPFVAKQMEEGAGIVEAIERWREYARLKGEIAAKDSAAEREVERIRQMREEIDRLVESSRDAGDAMAQAFGGVGDAIADVLDVFTVYAARRKELDADVLAGTKTQAQADAENKRLQLQSMGALAGSAKQFFKEGSAGYQAMAAAEKAFALVQLANTAVNVAAGASKMFAALGPFAFPAVAAMVAVMAGLGFGGGRGGSGYAPPSAEDMQAAAGTGSVLGDPRAASNSIANALDIMASNSNRELEFSNQMLRALKAIESGIGNLAGTIARQITVSGSMFDTSGLNIGQSGSGGFLGLFSSSTTRSLYDAGIDIATRSVGDILARGISGSSYQIVQQIKKSSGFLGIGGGTKTTYQTTTGALDADITGAIVDVIASLRAGLVQGADLIGLAGAQAVLDSFQVNIGRVSFAGMTGEEIEKQLNAIFSKVGDDMARQLYPQLAELQAIGEGAFETFMRVARQYQVVDTALASIGRTFGSVGLGSVKARDALIQLFGSMDEFVEQTTFFAEKFLTEQERIAPVAAAVNAELARLGLSSIDTMNEFKATVLGIDLTTEAGRELYAALMALAPAFATLHSSATETLNERRDLERRILELRGDTAALRALELAKLDESNRALQQQVWALEDAQEAARAADELRKAWASVGESIMDEVRRIRGQTANSGGFAAIMGRFNAATAAAKGGDMDAARDLPGLSQALLDEAAKAATSRQELDRVRAQTAATLEQVFASINGAQTAAADPTETLLTNIATIAATQADSAADTVDELRAGMAGLRDELALMREENNAGHAATAGNTGAIKRHLDNVTSESGGDAISTRAAA